MECGICYFTYDASEFFNLNCCKNNHVCLNCIKLLTIPLCPYCRTRISGLENNNNYRISISYPTPSLIQNDYIIDPRDDMYLDSRILRRQMKRLRKLQERERDVLYNKQLAQAYKESKKKNKNKINEEIKEDINIFNMEDI